MSKQYKPNIVRGGIAVPLGNNYFFMKGRKHKQGGIDVGKDLEVEDGEVMKLTKDNIKVFSAVPFLNGQSPVEKLLGGEDPNKVFAQQERFKKVNKINDDGTKAQLGKGKKITTTEIPESQQYAVTTPDGQRKVFNSKQEASDYVTANTPKGYSLYDITNYGTNIDKGQTAILNRNTEREIEKATKQEELAKARLATIQQNKEASKEMLSYMPVIGDGMDLYQLAKDVYNKQYGNAAISLAALTAPNWAGSLLKPIGKGIKKGYSKIKNILNTNNNFIDYTLNKNFKTNDIDPLTPQDEFTQYILFGNDDPNEIIKDYEYGKKHYFDIIDQNNYESELRKRLYSEDNIPRINKHIKPFKELNLGEQYKLLPEVEDVYYREHFNDGDVKNYDEIMNYIDSSYIDENSLVKSISDINEKNIGLITDYAWDDLYYKANKNNNLDEIQKLRNLHFNQKAIENKSNKLQYHGIANAFDPNFTVFNPQENHKSIFTSDDLNISTSYVNDFVTPDEIEEGIKLFKDKTENDINEYLTYAYQYADDPFIDKTHIKQAEEYSKKLGQMSKDELRELTLKANPYSPNRIKKLYTYLKNPIIFDNKGKQWSDIRMNDLPKDIQDLLSKNNKNIFSQFKTKDIEDISRKYGYDGVIINNMLDFAGGSLYKNINYDKPAQIVITNDPRKLKLADPITYDDNGKIIPLSERDDFTNPDTRYSWLLPTIGVGTGLSLINNNENNQYKYGGKMNRQKAPLGILKKIGQSLGLIEEDNKHNFPKGFKFESAPKKINTIEEDILNGKVYIGGKPNEARQKYFDLDKEFTDSVKAVSKRYGLNPNLVASRIAKEGPIDYGIELVNDSIGFNREQMDGAFWGLDDLGTHLAEGRVTIKEPWNRIKSNRNFTNEKGRDTNSVYSTEWVDGIYGTAAELKYRRDYMKKHFPDMTDEQLDAAAAASFNRGNYGARKWINNKGNYMQYKPFIKLKQMGGNHKLNTNQMANIYRVDSNGKTTWGMNFSTGGKSKGRQKAFYGIQQHKVNWSDPSPEDYRTMVTIDPIKMVYDPSVDETQYYGKDLPEVSVTRDIRVAPTNTSVDEMDVNRIITRKAKQPNKYYKPNIDPNIDYYAPTSDDYYFMFNGYRKNKNNVKVGPIFNNTVDVKDDNRETPKTYVSTKSNSPKSTSSKLRRKYWDNLSTYEDRPDNQVKSNKTNVDETQYYGKDLPELIVTRNVKKTNVVTPNTIKSTTNNKSVNYSVTNKKQTTSKQTTPNTSATKTTPKSNVTNNTSNITTPNNITRTAPIAKSTSQETPIFGLDAQNAFKKSIVGSKSNPDYIRGTFDFRDNKELVNKVDPNTIKVDSTNIRYKGAPSNRGYFKNYNAGDYISLGANVLGNIGSALINKHTLDNMEYASAPVPKMAIKQKTNFNINPQLDLSRERLREGVSDVNTNTASSSTALNRNNKLRLANIMNTNQLYSTKENMETQLINADRMNQQNVFNSNIDAFNTWNKEKNIFETAKQEKYGENKVGAVQGISQAVHDFINNNEKRRQFNNSLISIMAANPNVNPELYKVLGADWITDEHIRNWKLANNYKV